MDALLNILAILGMLVGIILLIAFLSIPLAALRNKLVHAIYTLFKLLAMPAIVAGRTLLQTKEWLVNHLLDTLDGLAHKNDDGDEYDVWPGWLILWPLVYLALLAGLALGDYYLFVLRFAVLFQLGTSQVVTVDVWTGIIWVTMVALWGSIFFDLAGVMHKASPFHKFSLETRRILTRLALVAVITALIAGALLWLWGQFDISGIDASVLTWAFVILFALLINSAIGMAGWAVFLSLGSIYALLLITLLLLCRVGLLVCYVLVAILSLLAAFVASIIDIPAHLGRLLWNWFCCFPLAVRWNMLPLEPFGQQAPIGRELVLTSQATASQALPSASYDTHTDSTDEVELPVMRSSSLPNTRLLNIVGSGSLTKNFLPALWGAFQQYHATSLVRTYGVIDLSRSHSISPYDLSRYGVTSISPTDVDLEKKFDRFSDAADVQKQITEEAVTRLVDANLDQRDTRSHILWAQPLPGMDDSMEQIFRDLIRHRQPHQHLIVCSELPFADQYDDSLIVDYQRLMHLQKENIVEGVVLLNRRSPYARLHGEHEQHKAVATTLVGIELAHQQSKYNAPLPEIMQLLASQEAFTGMAFSSKRFAGAGLLNARQARAMRNSGQFEHRLADLIAQSKAATDAVLMPEARGIDAHFDTDKPFYVIYMVPSDAQRIASSWSEYTRLTGTWLTQFYPKAIPLFVGMPHTRTSEANIVRVAALFSLPDMLPSLRAHVKSAANAQSATPTS